MTITEFREEIDRRIEEAESYYDLARQRSSSTHAGIQWRHLTTLRDIKALADRLNGEV